MKQRKSEINWKLVVRVACLMLLDVMLLYLACLLALLSRFDLSIHTLMRDSGFLPALHAAFPWMAIGMITLFIPLKLYSSLWEFAGVEELLHILCACFLFAAATLLLILFGVLDLPRSFPVLAGLYLVALLSASRFSYRLIRTILHRSGSEKRKKRTMLIGAGSAGMLVLREFQTSENSQNNVVCVIDDDRDKLGKYIRNVKIAGTREDIVALAQSRRIEEIVLAIPTAAVRERRNILQLCQKTGCRLKILPGIYQLANGEVNIQKIRNVDVQDLLGRDCVEVDLSQSRATCPARRSSSRAAAVPSAVSSAARSRVIRRSALCCWISMKTTPMPSSRSCTARIRSWTLPCASAPCATKCGSAPCLRSTGRTSCSTLRRTSMCR